MHCLDVLELNHQQDFPVGIEACSSAALLARLLERNLHNQDSIQKYITQRNRKSKKYHKNILEFSTLRQTNSSSQHNSACSSLKVSTNSMTEEIDSEVISPSKDFGGAEKEEGQQEQSEVKEKCCILQPIEEVHPCRPEELCNPVKTQPKSKKQKQSFSIDNSLKAALINKIRTMQEKHKQENRKESFISFQKGETLYGQNLHIKKIDIRPEVTHKKVKTEEAEPNLNQSRQIIRFKSRQSFDRNSLRCQPDILPQVIQGYQDRNKRCLQLFLKMNKSRYRSYKNRLTVQPEESYSPKGIRQKNNLFFRVSTLQLKKRL